MEQELQNLINQLKKAGVATSGFEAELVKVRQGQADANKLAQTMESTLRGVRAEAKGLSGEFGGIRDSLAAALSELAKTESSIKAGTKAYRNLTSQVNQLAQEEEGITDLHTKQLTQINQKAQAGLADIQVAAKRLALEKGIVDISKTNLGFRKDLTDEERALLQAYQQGFKQEKAAVQATAERLAKEKLVTSQIGLTGAALSGTSKILETLGLGGLSSEVESITSQIRTDMRKELEKNKTLLVSGDGSNAYLSLEKDKEAIQGKIDKLESVEQLNEEQSKQLQEHKERLEEIQVEQEIMVENGEAMVEVQYEQVSLAKKFGIAASAAGQLLTKAFDKISDPAAIFAFVGKALLEGSSRAAKLQKELTISKGAAEGLKNELALAASASGSNFITSEKLTKSYLEMTKYIGQSAHILGNEALVSATYLTEKLHLSGEAAGQLVTMTRLTGRSTEDTFKNMGKVLTNFNKTNKTAFNLKDLMEAVGSASKATVLTLGKSPEALLKAAAAAKKVGLNLGEVEKVADSLLDFESSIENELQAQLLTGNALNLNKAREMAMMGDMEGLAKEIGNQEAIKNAFATKNVIAQKAAAQALGMSREELAKMTYQQELNTMGAEKFKAKYGEVAYESAKAQSAQDKFTDAIAKMQSILGDVIGAFSPLIDGVAYLVSIPVVPYIMAIAVAAKALGGNPLKGMVGGIKAASEGLKGYLGQVKGAKGVGAKVKSMLGLGDKTGGLTKDAQGRFRDAKGRFAKNPMGKTMDKGAEATGKMKEKTKGAKNQGPGGFLKSLGQGLASIGKKFGDVVKGALALGIAGVAIGGSFALALKMVEGVDPKTMLAFAASIGIFGGALALVGRLGNDAIKGALAMGIVGVSLIPAAYAFKMMAGVDTAQIIGLSGAMIVLGGAAAILGALSSNIMTGALALGVLGLALVPAAFAFNLLKGVDTNSIVAFSIALPLLALAAAGLGFLAPFIMAGATALAVLGAAMIPAAVAFNIMAKADLEKIATGLIGIASVGPQLALAGIGMVALAGGAAVLGLASPMLLFAGRALGFLGVGAQMAANANLEGVASQLTQLGAIGPGLVQASTGLFAIAGGLMAFGLAMAGASAIGGLTSLFGGGVMGDLQALAAMAEPLATVGASLTAIAAGLSGVALALSTLETEKIDELKGLIATTAFSAPMIAASGAITELISGLGGGGTQETSNAALEAKLDELIAAVKQGGTVYIDGNKAGEALLMASYKSS